MGKMQSLPSSDLDGWIKVLKNMEIFDFYHLPCYHQIAEMNKEGHARLFYYQQGDYHIALPLLLRPIEEIPGLEKIGEKYYDATSVYGYAGPLVSHSNIPDNVIQDFRSELHKALKEQCIVSVFSRLHPFLPQYNVLTGIGAIDVVGVTISIDLNMDIDEQRRQYSKGHKSGVNKLHRLGVVCHHDTELQYLPEFLEIYYETMDRVGASNYYYFPPANFKYMINHLRANIHLFVCELEKEIICGGIYIECNGIVQAYLGGMRSKYRTIAPRKLEKDMVRIWATESGHSIFHLGGGVGAQKDSLYEFKAGFSKRRHDFSVWKWITDQDVYDQLVAARQQKSEMSEDNNYFPIYRKS